MEKRENVTPFVGVWIETDKSRTFASQSRVTPFVGVWIETIFMLLIEPYQVSHPSWVCGLKQFAPQSNIK